MRVSERIFFTARFTRDAEFADRKDFFFSGERPEKKKSYSVMAMHIKTSLRTTFFIAARHVVICFPSPQRKTNQKINSVYFASLR